MTTKQQYIAMAKTANPKPLFSLSNGHKTELTDEEYDHCIEQWAEMRIQQDLFTAKNNEKQNLIEAALNKLKTLGLTDDEIEALLGVARG